MKSFGVNGKKVILVIFILLVLVFILVQMKHSGACLQKSEDVTRFATYNMMFGMYGRWALPNLFGHFAFHGIHSPFLTRTLSLFNSATVRLAGKTNADIVVLNEVLGTLRKDKLIEDLKKEGYEYFCWGAANHHDAPLDIGTLIASKIKFEKLNFTMPQAEKMGGGGGACAILIREKNLSVLGLHLGLKSELFDEQIVAVSKFVNEQKKLKRKVIVMGDFNQEEKELNEHPDFKSLNLIAASRKNTCPDIEEIKLFKFEAVDNIFHDKSIQLKKSCVLEGYSDHLMVWADLEI